MTLSDAIDEPRAPAVDDLVVDRFSLAIGPVSVGLPLTGTPEAVLGRYLELRALLGDTGALGPIDVPGQHLEALAVATGQDRDAVAARLVRLRP